MMAGDRLYRARPLAPPRSHRLAGPGTSGRPLEIDRASEDTPTVNDQAMSQGQEREP